jgi:GntR family transcriptional regulator/MocR family aminotransferase
MRGIYQERRRLLLALLQAELGEWLAPIPSTYGMHVAALARAPLDLERLSGRLARNQLHIHGLDRYYLGEGRSAGLVFGYGVVDPAQIRRGVGALRRSLA